VGTSTAYHLAKLGCRVVLLEMFSLTAGSTWHAAGLVTSFHTTANIKPIHKYSLDVMSQLEKETGQEIGFHRCGSVRVATTEERAEEMRYQISRNKTRGYPFSIMTPAEVKAMVPLVDQSKVKLGIHSYDGHVDPYSLTQAFAKGARSNGAELRQGVKVTGLEELGGGAWTVRTSHGDINTNCVINAAGFYGKEVGEMAGQKLPLVSTEHQYIVTKSLPEVQQLPKEMPVLRIMEASTYVRQERDGLLLGTYERPDEMKFKKDWYETGVPDDFSKQLFDDDVERSAPYMEMVMDVMPCVERAQFRSVVNGPIVYTPDGLPMVGPSMKPGMWHAVGFSFGIVHSGGVGKALAEYVMRGEPPTELIELDPARFELPWLTDEIVLDKVRETYGMLNHPHYPHEERPAGRPSGRVSSAYAPQKGRGASFLPHAGWEQPAWFAGEGETPQYKPSYERPHWHPNVVAECRTVTEGCGIIDLTPFAKYKVKGAQAAELFSRVAANSVPALGRCVVTHMLTASGGIFAELTVTRTGEEEFLVVSGSGSEGHDLRWLKEKAQVWGLERLSFSNVTDEQGVLGVAGTTARQLLTKGNPAFGEKFPFFGMKQLELCGVPMTAIRLSYTGEDGWELYHDRASTGKLYQALLEMGGDLGVGDFGTHALNTLRQEKGFRGWATEMTTDTSLVQAGYQSFVDLKKGDFHGRDAYLRQSKQVPENVLVQAIIPDTPLDPEGDEAIYANDHLVGNTTSGCYSPALGASLAFCYLPPFLAAPDTIVQVELMSKRYPAVVLPCPPVASIRQRLAEARRARVKAEQAK